MPVDTDRLNDPLLPTSFQPSLLLSHSTIISARHGTNLSDTGNHVIDQRPHSAKGSDVLPLSVPHDEADLLVVHPNLHVDVA